MSNRIDDKKTEEIINDFLFKNYFKIFNNAKLIDDKTLQCKGVDAQICGINFDFKAQSSKKYLNNPTDTFILELSFINRAGNKNVGWFLNNEVITDYYCFIWIPETETNENGLIDDISQLKKVEVMIVNKKALKDNIISIKSIKEIEEIDNKMRENEYRHNGFNDEIHFSYNPTLREKPINLVCKKSYLKKFSEQHFYLTNDEKVINI